jgi:UDPglucose 6-dehydrogenase
MIAVFGLGFVGLATALSFAEKGFEVLGFDIDRARVATLRQKKLPFYEPGLDVALARHLDNNFKLVDSAQAAMSDADFVFFCVGTPAGDDGAADLSILEGAISAALDGLPRDRFRVLVVKSTVPPGTTDECVVPLVKKLGWRVGEEIGIANNPEFLREGHAWEDVFNCDRIVIGVADEMTGAALRKLHAPFGVPIHVVSLNTGEFIKYISNTLFATLISYANDAARLADAIGGIDIVRAFEVLRNDHRWSGNPCYIVSHYVHPGCGYGGYCLPKDVAALLAKGRARGYDSPILGATQLVNNERMDYVASQIAARARKDRPIGILGLSFKEGSDDVRQSTSKEIIARLTEQGFHFVAYDPLANEEFRKTYPQLPINYVGSSDEVLDAADPAVILTPWPEFRELRRRSKVLDFRYMR